MPRQPPTPPAVALEQVLFRLHARVSRSVAAVLDAPARRVVEASLFALAAAALAAFLLLHVLFVAPYGPPQCLAQRAGDAMRTSGVAAGAPEVFRLRILPPGVDSAAMANLRRALEAHVRREERGGGGGADSADVDAGRPAPLPAELELARYLDAYFRVRAEAEAAAAAAASASPAAAAAAQRRRAGQPDASAISGGSAHAAAWRRGDAHNSSSGSSSSVTWRVEAELSVLLRRMADDVTTMYVAGDHVYNAAAAPSASGAGAPAAATAAEPAEVDRTAQPLVAALRRWVAHRADAMAAAAAAQGDATGDDAAAGTASGGVGWRRVLAPPLAPLAAGVSRWFGWWYGSFAPGLARTRHRSSLRVHSYLLSADRGLLAMSPAMRDALGVRLASLDVPADDPCLGGPVARALLRDVAGYDTAAINGLLQAAASLGGTNGAAGGGLVAGGGYVQAEHSGETHALSHARDVPTLGAAGLPTYVTFKLGTLCSAVFLLWSTSSLVSFILGQTQQRMLRFTVDLQHHVRARLPLLPLVASHLLESLAFVPLMLGVLFFLFEFFGDQLLAFLVTLLVWAAELWSVVGCRTSASLAVFPAVFGTAMTAFHVYFLSHPFGYKYLALQGASLVLAATSFALWNRFELPALQSGDVSHHQPRQPRVAAALAMQPVVGGTGLTAAVGGAGGGGGGAAAAAAAAAVAAAAAARAHAVLATPPRTPTLPAGDAATAAINGAAAAGTGVPGGSPPRPLRLPSSQLPGYGSSSFPPTPGTPGTPPASASAYTSLGSTPSVVGAGGDAAAAAAAAAADLRQRRATSGSSAGSLLLGLTGGGGGGGESASAAGSERRGGRGSMRGWAYNDL